MLLNIETSCVTLQYVKLSIVVIDTYILCKHESYVSIMLIIKRGQYVMVVRGTVIVYGGLAFEYALLCGCFPAL